MRVSIVKTGSAFPALRERRGDYDGWIADAMGATEVDLVDVQNGAALPDPAGPTAVVVTGSSSLVTDREAWSERTRPWLAERARLDLPMLAICYGHQLLADALDGSVRTHPAGRQMGSIEVTVTDAGQQDALLGSLPPKLTVSASHRQHVNALPSGAVLLATTPHDHNHAFRLGRHIWAVQFHPEWDDDVMRSYIASRRDTLLSEGLDPEQMIADVRPNRDGAAILARFAELVS
ncbi:MAG: glutamine amidotransferase [Sandaracinaceae bacterium]